MSVCLLVLRLELPFKARSPANFDCASKYCIARVGEEERDKMRRNFEDLFAKERDLSERRRVEELGTAERRANDRRKEIETNLTRGNEALDKKYQQVRRLPTLVQKIISWLLKIWKVVLQTITKMVKM